MFIKSFYGWKRYLQLQLPRNYVGMVYIVCLPPYFFLFLPLFFLKDFKSSQYC